MLSRSENTDIFAVVPAAGKSTRMKTLGSAESKVLLPLKSGQSILEQSLQSLWLAGVKSCVIPTSNHLIDKVNAHIRNIKTNWDNLVVVEGGETRFDSVYRGITYLKRNFQISTDSLLLVHDAARPFCSPELIKSAIDLSKCGEGVVLAVPVVNTIKQCSTNGLVINTLDRDTLFEIQTPQVFNFVNLFESYLKAASYLDKSKIFDDASVYEMAGFPVRILRSTRENIKITFGDECSFED